MRIELEYKDGTLTTLFTKEGSQKAGQFNMSIPQAAVFFSLMGKAFVSSVKAAQERIS